MQCNELTPSCFIYAFTCPYALFVFSSMLDSTCTSPCTRSYTGSVVVAAASLGLLLPTSRATSIVTVMRVAHSSNAKTDTLEATVTPT